jgi:hypothetical protein
MKIEELYRRSVYYPSFILLLITLVYSVIYFLGYKRDEQIQMYEWYERVAINLLMAIIYCIIIGICSLTTLLNKYEKVRSNVVLSYMTWFLLPLGFIFTTIGKAINELVDVGSIWELVYALVAGVPFIIGLFLGFRKFNSQGGIKIKVEHSS